jgi:COP9 signalosome complex subunit 7
MSVPASSSEALDGFCVLAKSSSGVQCVMVIKQVLKHPSIFVFGELLDVNNIQEVSRDRTS